jgi:hypothetical protein
MPGARSCACERSQSVSDIAPLRPNERQVALTSSMTARFFRADSHMRVLFLLTAVAILSSCADSIIGPNTDVGLSVWTQVSPPILSIRDTTTVLRIRVFVGNKTDHEIRVVSGGPPYVFTFGSEPVPHSGLWGSLRIAGDSSAMNAGPGVDWWGDSVYVFPAHRAAYNEQATTLREWKARGWAVRVGNYVARGWFNGREGRSAPFYFVP